MKRFANAILGLSLVVGSASFAQDNLAGFYPAEDVDSPSYVQDFSANVVDDAVYTLAVSSVSDGAIKALYAKDAWEYSRASNANNNVVNSAKSTISADLEKVLYQES